MTCWGSLIADKQDKGKKEIVEISSFLYFLDSIEILNRRPKDVSLENNSNKLNR